MCASFFRLKFTVLKDKSRFKKKKACTLRAQPTDSPEIDDHHCFHNKKKDRQSQRQTGGKEGGKKRRKKGRKEKSPPKNTKQLKQYCSTI